MKLAAALLFLMPLSLSAATSPSTPAAADPAEVIRRLYQNHQPWNHKEVDYENPVVAARYFDDSLIALFRKEREAAERANDMGCVDFDPFLQAQDYDDAGITEPRIREVERSEGKGYEVTFTGRSEAWKGWNARAVYIVVKTNRGWRIHDIEFDKGGSLRRTLGCKH